MTSSVVTNSSCRSTRVTRGRPVEIKLQRLARLAAVDDRRRGGAQLVTGQPVERQIEPHRTGRVGGGIVDTEREAGVGAWLGRVEELEAGAGELQVEGISGVGVATGATAVGGTGAAAGAAASVGVGTVAARRPRRPRGRPREWRRSTRSDDIPAPPRAGPSPAPPSARRQKSGAGVTQIGGGAAALRAARAASGVLCQRCPSIHGHAALHAANECDGDARGDQYAFAPLQRRRRRTTPLPATRAPRPTRANETIGGMPPPRGAVVASRAPWLAPERRRAPAQRERARRPAGRQAAEAAAKPAAPGSSVGGSAMVGMAVGVGGSGIAVAVGRARSAPGLAYRRAAAARTAVGTPPRTGVGATSGRSAPRARPRSCSRMSARTRRCCGCRCPAAGSAFAA